MKRIILSFSQVLVVIAFLFGFEVLTSGQKTLPLQNKPGKNIQQHIMDATVQITIEVPDPRSLNAKIVETAFGTVITHAGETILVTHNHWKQLSAEAGIVYLRNINHQILFFSPLSDFRRRVRYADEGTMIFKVPATVQSDPRLHTVHEAAQPAVGDTVLITHRDIFEADSSRSITVTFHRARVQAVEVVKGVPVYRLQSLDGQSVMPGNSGGGVWFDGQFVANLWMTIMVETESLAPTEEPANVPRPTDLSIAARFPPG